jgi:hypothetical protein
MKRQFVVAVSVISILLSGSIINGCKSCSDSQTNSEISELVAESNSSMKPNTITRHGKLVWKHFKCAGVHYTHRQMGCGICQTIPVLETANGDAWLEDSKIFCKQIWDGKKCETRCTGAEIGKSYAVTGMMNERDGVPWMWVEKYIAK